MVYMERLMIRHAVPQTSAGCSDVVSPSCRSTVRTSECCSVERTSVETSGTACKARGLKSSRIPIVAPCSQFRGDERCGATAASLRRCSVGNSARWRSPSSSCRPSCVSSRSGGAAALRCCSVGNSARWRSPSSSCCLSSISSGSGGAGQLGSSFLPRLEHGAERTSVWRKCGSAVNRIHRRPQVCRSRASLSGGLWERKFHGQRRGGAERASSASRQRGSSARRGSVAVQSSAAAAAAGAPRASQNFFARLWANFVAICASWAYRLQSIKIGWLDLLTMLRIVLLAAGAFGVYVVSKRAWAKFREKADGKPGGGGAAAGGGGSQDPMQVLARGATSFQLNMGQWSIADMTIGLTAMAKVTEKRPPPFPGKEEKDLSEDSIFLLRAQHWRVLAEAVYAKDSASFSLFSHLPESSLVASAWEPSHETFRPAYAVVVDAPYGAVVLAVRGTSHMIDMLLNSGASPEAFGDDDGYAHGGFVHAAKVLHEEVLPHIEKAFKDHSVNQKELKLVIVGHSMGAAVGSLIALKLREKWPDLQCWAYSPPACMSPDLAEKSKSFTTTFVAGHDLVPRMSFQSVERLRTRIQEFDWDEFDDLAKDDEDCQNMKTGIETFRKIQKAQIEALETIRNLGDNGEEESSSDSQKTTEETEKSEEIQKADEKSEKEGGGLSPRTLHPPGMLLVLGSDPPGCGKIPGQRSNVASQRNYGSYPSYDEAKQVTWRMFKVEQEDLEEIVVSPWIVSDHMLGTLHEAISYFQSKCPPAMK